MSRPYTCALILLLVSLKAYGQDVGRVLEVEGGVPDTTRGRALGNIFFERNLNTFNWLGSAVIDSSFGSLSLKVNEQYTSNIILTDATPTSPERRLQSNKHNVSLLPGWTISDNVALLGRWSSLVFSDNRAVGVSTASFHNLHGGANISPLRGLTFNPMMGYRWDNQGVFHDQGLSYDIGAQTNPRIDLDGYQLSGLLRFNQDHVDPRLLENHMARIGLQKRFDGATRDSLEVQFVRNRREFYSLSSPASAAPIDTSIESRVDDVLSFANLLDYEVSRGFLATFYLGVSNRMLDKDIRFIGTGNQSTPQFGTTIEEFHLNAFVQTMYRSDDGESFAMARFQFNERNETHAAKPLPGVADALFRVVNETEKTKDNLTRRTTFSGSLRFPLSRSDHLGLSGSAGILRYDTPHIQNVEDRDEQLFTLGLTTSHNISQYLNLNIALGGSISHVVYLLGDRSANNNFNRVIRLIPRVDYRPWKKARTINSFEVLANYTVYDFEEQAALIRSFSYRQFSWLDSTTVSLTDRVSLDFLAYLKLYERGQLKWSEFTERTESSFADETYAVQVRFSPGGDLTFATGLRYFEQTRYVYSDAVKTFDSRLKSFGPTCTIEWRVSRFNLIQFSGWYEERRQSEGKKRTLPNMTLNIHLTL